MQSRLTAARILALAGVLGALACAPGPSRAQKPLDAGAIVARSQQAFFAPGKDMKARIHMTLTAKSGQKRIRDLTLLRRNEAKEGEQKYFIYFHEPADVAGMTLLVAKFPGRDDDRWLFMPALNLVKRIAARDAAQSFVGSDFTYEHVSGRDLDADTYALLRAEKANGRPCYVVESHAQAPAEYKRKVAWIDKTTFLPVKEEYYDAKGELFKIFTADEITSTGGVPTIARRSMQNVKTGHRTDVVFSNVAYNVGIEPNVFTERYLKAPPKRWVQ